MAAKSASRGKDVESLRADIASLQENLETLAGSLKSNGEGAVHWAEDRIGYLRELLEQLVDATREKGGRGATFAQDAVRSHPFWSTLAAFAAGAIAGMLIGRRSD